MIYKSISLLIILCSSFIGFGQVSNGLFAKYSFNNGTANDEVGIVNGTYSNILFIADRFGNSNQAVDFQNTNSYIDFGDNFDRFSMIDSSFSMSFWIQSTAIGNELIVSKYGNNTCSPTEHQREFFIRINSSNLIEMVYFTNLASGSFRGVQGDVTINDTCWHHVVINYNGNLDTNNGLDRVEIFIDNVQNITSFSSSVAGGLGNIQNSSSHLGMGMSLNSSGQPCSHQFVGKLDDVRFYARELSILEIDSLYFEVNPLTETNQGDFAQFQISSDTICQGECIDFLDMSINCPNSWEWTFENANIVTSSDTNPTNICYSIIGTQEVVLIVENGYSTDTLRKFVKVIPSPILDLGADTTICAGDFLMLDAFQPDISNYLWQDGSMNPNFIITEEGLYFIEVTNSCETIGDSINVDYIDLSLDFGADSIAFCENELSVLDAFHPLAINYLWNNGSAESTLEVSESGAYHVEISNSCETLYDSVNVIISKPKLLLELGENQNTCGKDSILLDASSENGIWYQWQDGSTSPYFLVFEAGEYQVIVKNGCGIIKDSILITNQNCCSLFLPSAFTPNNDGMNDVFKVKKLSEACSNILDFSFKIFDRWGQMIYSSNDINLGWDGNSRGRKLGIGVYVFMIRYNDGLKNQMKSGNVTLLR